MKTEEKGWEGRSFYNVDDKIDHIPKSKPTKMILDSCIYESISIKSFAVKEKKRGGWNNVSFIWENGNVCKFSLMSFIYDILETFCFPNKKVKLIYEKYQIETVYIYHILTDTDSTSLKFVFISNAASEIPNTKHQQIIFEVLYRQKLLREENVAKVARFS